jgi:demethylmenaquinone methyltransferase/2-methoxy-6-polyprenyl-1,4-benzoquinol methylase
LECWEHLSQSIIPLRHDSYYLRHNDMMDSSEDKQTTDPRSATPLTHFGYRLVPEGEKVKWVYRHFDTVARKYDLMNTLLSFGIHLLWKRNAVRMLDLAPGDRVLDVCGGTADLSILAARRVGPTGTVTLYDMNWKMMQEGRPKVQRAAMHRNVHYTQGDAEHLSFREGTFDAAMVGFGVRNLTHPEAGIREIFRVLRPHGKFMCLEFSTPVWGWFRRLYDFYSFRIMPLVGATLGGSRQAYTYLPESIRLFSLPNELSEAMARAGFVGVRYRRLSNGIAAVHLGTKPVISNQ